MLLLPASTNGWCDNTRDQPKIENIADFAVAEAIDLLQSGRFLGVMS
jgi:hypothetical protein